MENISVSFTKLWNMIVKYKSKEGWRDNLTVAITLEKEYFCIFSKYLLMTNRKVRNDHFIMLE